MATKEATEARRRLHFHRRSMELSMEILHLTYDKHIELRKELAAVERAAIKVGEVRERGRRTKKGGGRG